MQTTDTSRVRFRPRGRRLRRRIHHDSVVEHIEGITSIDTQPKTMVTGTRFRSFGMSRTASRGTDSS